MTRKFSNFVRVALCLASIILATSTAGSVELALRGDDYWVVLASRQNVDEAIALAREYSYSVNSMVVRAVNGWFAVVEGPETAKAGSGRAVLDALIKTKSLPNDIFFTKRTQFTDIVWTPSKTVLRTLDYDGMTDATLQDGDLRIIVSRVPSGEEGQFLPSAKGYVNGKLAFEMIPATENTGSEPAAHIRLIRLDGNSRRPQVIFTYFWLGAHCCTVTKVASMQGDGKWTVIDGEDLDADGYEFEDLDGSGSAELISLDQDFLYAFDSYAASTAPIRIHRLVGDKLVDVTLEPVFRNRLIQQLYALESRAPAGNESWHSNGFLAGWVASKILLGQGPDAWSKMLANFDRKSDFGPQECTIARSLESCPEDKKRMIPFPIALKSFLVDHGYIQDQSLYPIPDSVRRR